MNQEERLASIAQQLKTIPRKPGVYVIYDEQEKIIYVGKAKSLNNRLRSHFTKSNDFSKSRVIREKGARIEIHQVRSENEALLLEYNMIQEHQPVLNERWKDGKTYPYLEITTGETFPRFITTRERINPNSIYLGPFSDLGAVKRSLKYVLHLFPVADCKNEIHLGDDKSWAKTCIRRRTKQCLRPCELEINVEEYRDSVDHVIKFIEGKVPEIAENLEVRMIKASETQHFEEAAKFRDILKSITRTMERQQVMVDNIDDVIVISDAKTKYESCVSLLKLQKGRIVRQEALAIDRDELEDNSWGDYVLNFFVTMLGLAKNEKNENDPANVIIQTINMNQVIPRMIEFGFEVSQPESSIDNSLIEMAKSHAKRILQRRALLRKNVGVPTKRVEDLQEILQLEYPPFIIDTFDVSTLFGTNNVASCVRFRNGKPLKKGYRRFKIQTVKGQDDFASMEEVVFRRYRDVKDGVDPKDLPIPDLIVIDGGAEQLKRAKLSLSKLNLDITVIGLAKREEEIYQVGEKYPLNEDKNRNGILLIRACRDEAHRFAVKYQRQLRLKQGLASILDEIEGIGPKRRTRLLSKYRTITNIAKESSETLSESVGISQTLASAVILEARKFTTIESDKKA